MKKLEFHGRPLYYQKTGSGPAVLLIHGFCEDHSIWEDLAALLESSYEVIAMDLPGFGRSAPGADPSVDYYADAAGAVLEALGIARAALIGHSMGGYAALAFAEKFPDQVAGLGLFHSHPFADAGEKKEARLKSIEFIERNGSAPFAKQLIPTLFAPAFAQSHPVLVQKLADHAAAFPTRGLQDGLLAMRNRPDRAIVLKKATFPVLFIIGAQDAAVPHAYSMDQTHLSEVASIHLLQEVGHMGMFEAPEETGAAVQDFLRYVYG